MTPGKHHAPSLPPPRRSLSAWLSRANASDPIYALLYRIFRGRALLAAILSGLAHLLVWSLTGLLVNRLYPTRDLANLNDFDELSFGLFLWGFFIPVIWWYYLSLNRLWSETLNSLCQEGVVSNEIRSILSARPSTWLAFLVAFVIGVIYLYNAIPAEIALGRVSFWFAAPWSKALILLLVMLNAYIFVSFLLKTVLYSYRMRLFFNQHGILNLCIFHVDEVGGFGAVGSLAMRISALAVLAGLWAVWFSLLPLFARGQANMSLTVLLIYIAYFILAFLILLSLTWPVHRAMKAYQRAYKRRVAEQLEQAFFSIVNGDWSQPHPDEQLLKRLDDYKRLTQVVEKIDSMPVWPLSLKNFKRFTGFASLPGIIGFVSFLFDIVDVSSAFRNLTK